LSPNFIGDPIWNQSRKAGSPKSLTRLLIDKGTFPGEEFLEMGKTINHELRKEKGDNLTKGDKNGGEKWDHWLFH